MSELFFTELIVSDLKILYRNDFTFKVQQREFNKDSRADLIVNGVCPGYTSTAMSSFGGHSTDEGRIISLNSCYRKKKLIKRFILKAVPTIIHLALLDKNVSEPKGEFWAEMKPFDWKKASWSFK